MKLCKEEVQLEMQKMKACPDLVCSRCISYNCKSGDIHSAQLNYITKHTVYYHNDGYFRVRFASIDDRDEVLYSGPQC